MSSIVMLRLIQQCLDPWLDETPRSSVQWLFLTPHDGFGVLVGVKIFLQVGPGKWVELFNARDGGVFDAFVGAVFVEGGVDLTCADDDTVDLVGLGDGFAVLGVGYNPFEIRLAREVFEAGTCERVS
jgi:hypothetical protein